MRVGDQTRLIAGTLLGACVPAALVAVVAQSTGRVSVWWVLPVALAAGTLTAWAMTTIFGLSQIARLAAQAAHGGRHYYFEQREIGVVFDDAGQVWLRLKDLQACVGGSAAVVRHFQGDEASLVQGKRRDVYLSVGGVRRLLKLNRHADRQKFLLWFERELLAPIEQRRARSLPLHSTGDGQL